MALTAPGCPVAGEMPGWVQNAVSAVDGSSDVEVNMVFDPPWTPDRMSEEGAWPSAGIEPRLKRLALPSCFPPGPDIVQLMRMRTDTTPRVMSPVFCMSS